MISKNNNTDMIPSENNESNAKTSSNLNYYPILAFGGIILAIIVGAIIIGFSIILASGRGPASLNKYLSVGDTYKTGDIQGLQQGQDPISQKESVPEGPVNIELKDSYAMVGVPEAPVTIVEFADFQCPFCKEFHDKALSQIRTKYVETGKVKLYFMQFPFLGPESESAAIASECARQQGKFWDYHDFLYEVQGAENSDTYSDAQLTDLAKQLNLDMGKFASCQKNPETANIITEQIEKGQEYGVSATPSLFINGKKVEGSNPFKQYQTLIEAELNK